MSAGLPVHVVSRPLDPQVGDPDLPDVPRGLAGGPEGLVAAGVLTEDTGAVAGVALAVTYK